MNDKKVLICAPIGMVNEPSINLWFEWISNQDHKNYEFALCCNGAQKYKIFSKLKQVEIFDIHGQTKKPIIEMLFKDKKLTVIQKITYARELLRRKAIQLKCDAIFFMDLDTIPLSKNALTRLLNHDKDSITGLYHYKNSQVALIIDNDTKTNMTKELIEKLVFENQITTIIGSGYGCVLHQRVALMTPFDFDLFGGCNTDDFGHCHALLEAGVKLWFDPFVLCKHYCFTDPLDKFKKGLGVYAEIEGRKN